MAAGGSVDRESITRMLDKEWEENGPAGHPYEDLCRRDADLMVHHPLDYVIARTEVRMLRPQL